MNAPSTILLVRPKHFGYNPETAGSNAFQSKPSLSLQEINQKAVSEFDAFAERLRSKGVNVFVFDDTAGPVKPDAVFPNNWVSFHPDGTVILYPMLAPNRRHERRKDVIETLTKTFQVKKTLDLSEYEDQRRFLEGTGSIVFDYRNRRAYACVSPRTDVELLAEVCRILDYKPVVFVATDRGGKAIYHTNVMMCVGKGFSVICLESIAEEAERAMVRQSLEEGHNEVIPITFSQMDHFAGNMLAVQGDKNQLLVMSASAFGSLADEQKQKLERYCELVPMEIDTIETIGGGSARCMMAEVLLPLR